MTVMLPLPHAWFEAPTALPRRRSRLAAGEDPVAALHARAALAGSAAFPAAITVLDSKQQSFDSYFGVGRAEGPPLQVLQTAFAQILPRALGDLGRGHSLTEAELRALVDGLLRVADWALIPIGDGEAPALQVPDHGALGRWKDQHLLFFLLIHTLLLLVCVLEEGLDKAHAPVVEAVLEDIERVLLASAAAFKLAADFSAEDYDSLIRPDMMAHDPHFSGLFYADHKELISALRVLRQVPADFAEEMARVDAALTAAYEAHAHVCARFVGGQASLASKDESREAPAQIRGKYMARTRTIAGFR